LKKSGLDGLKAVAMQNAKLDERTAKRIPYDGQEDERAWIKRMFACVNSGELTRVAIPRKIHVGVSEAVLSGSPLSRFEAVVDTKGSTRTPSGRISKSTLPERIRSASLPRISTPRRKNNITELMRYYLTSRSKDFHHRFVTLVLPHKGNPENITGETGLGKSARRSGEKTS